MATRVVDVARRLTRFAPSRSVRDILELAERPDVISLAGGLPDPEVFDIDRVRESMDRVLRDEGRAALNYGPNPGFSKLREWIAQRMGSHENVAVLPENILVASGGVEGLNLTAMALVDPGDTVLVEAPTYMMALHVFRAHEARIVSVPTDEGGLDTDALEARLVELSKKGVTPKLIYLNPSFQNPSGRTLSLTRRQQTVALCRRHHVTILEDHAYAELVYDGEPVPSFKSLDPDNVIFVHTFSKIFGPGVRLGWVAADTELIDNLGLCKLGTDQCSNTLTQRLVYDYGRNGLIDEQVARSIALYRAKRDAMQAAMSAHFPEPATWEPARGGFFLWVRLTHDTDTEALLRGAIEREKTAFVAGSTFFAEGGGADFLRLSFSFVPSDQIDEAIQRLSRAIAAGR
jgi:2-aminoadipate transaminase